MLLRLKPKPTNPTGYRSGGECANAWSASAKADDVAKEAGGGPVPPALAGFGLDGPAPRAAARDAGSARRPTGFVCLFGWVVCLFVLAGGSAGYDPSQRAKPPRSAAQLVRIKQTDGLTAARGPEGSGCGRPGLLERVPCRPLKLFVCLFVYLFVSAVPTYLAAASAST